MNDRHTRECAFLLRGGVCNCGTVNPSHWDVDHSAEINPDDIRDYVWKGYDDEYGE